MWLTTNLWNSADQESAKSPLRSPFKVKNSKLPHRITTFKPNENHFGPNIKTKLKLDLV